VASIDESVDQIAWHHTKGLADKIACPVLFHFMEGT
jgi:hypothetical protein